MSKAQKDKILKLNVNDKKLTRLFHNKRVNEKDQLFLNYMYEEKQHLNFFYGICLNGFFTMMAQYALLRQKAFMTKFVFFTCTWSLIHVGTRRLIDDRFYTLLTPYYEKYQVK